MNQATNDKKYDGFLPNYPDYRDRLRTIANRLDTLSDTTLTHLADVGSIIRGYTKELEELQKEIFETHNAIIK